MDKIRFSEYETISIEMAYTDDDGYPMALPDTIEANIVSRSNQVVAHLEVIRDVARLGFFTLKTNAVIKKGEYLMNVMFTQAGIRQASPTFELLIDYSPTVPSVISGV